MQTWVFILGYFTKVNKIKFELLLQMHEKKIENFTDKIIFKSRRSRNSIPPLTDRSQLSINNNMKGSYSRAYSNRNPFPQPRRQQGLTNVDIDKLQLMYVNLTPDDYLNKLIKIHEENRQAKMEAEFDEIIEESDEEYEDVGIEARNSMSKLLIMQTDEKISIKDMVKKNAGSLQGEPSINNFKFEEFQRSPANKRPSRNRKPRSSEPEKQAALEEKKEKLVLQNQEEAMKKSILKRVKFTQGQEEQNTKLIGKQQGKVGVRFTQQQSLIGVEVESDCEDIELNQQKQPETKKQPSINKIFTQRAQQSSSDQADQISLQKQLQQLCYMQIGRRMVSVTQKQIRRQFFRTNIHIRSYLMRNIVQYVQNVAKTSPDSVFILPGERALHYETSVKPPQLNTYLQHTKYVEIIRNVNHIIQKNIYKQRYQKPQSDYWPITIMIVFLVLVAMVSTVVFVDHNDLNLKNAFLICTGLLICVFLVILIGYSLHCYRKQVHFRPICDIISQEIAGYFKFINGKMENRLEWILGESFFWIEIKMLDPREIQMKNKIKAKTKIKNRFPELNMEDNLLGVEDESKF